jgi:SPP1 family holin
MDTGTIARLIISIIAAINAAAAAFGFNPFDVDEQTIYSAVSFVAALITWIWGFWKNNDFTEPAREGTALTHRLKAKAKGPRHMK